MKATTGPRGFAKLGALAMGFAAAVLAFAICMPANANAYTYSYDEATDTATYTLRSADTDVKLNMHENCDKLVLQIVGTPSIKDHVYNTGEITIIPTMGFKCTLNVNGSISNNDHIAIGGNSPLTVNVKNPMGGACAIMGAKVTIKNCTVNATNTKGSIALRSYGDLTINNSTVNATTTGSYGSFMGEGIYVDEGMLYVYDSTVTATAPHIGIETGVSGMMVEDSTVIGKATKKTTATGSKPAYGLSIHYTIDIMGDSNVKGYAYAPLKSLTKGVPNSAGIICQELDASGGNVYAYNSGKYAVGLYAKEVSTLDLFGSSTVKAYAKNYGIGISTSGSLSFNNATATIYGGKYAIYSKDTVYFTNSTVKAYGKNTKGTRTGHGVYSLCAMDIVDSDVLVYAKKSSSYYGLYAKYAPFVTGQSKVRVYSYSTRAFVGKNASGKLTKGQVAPGSLLYVNGTKQTKYPVYAG